MLDDLMDEFGTETKPKKKRKYNKKAFDISGDQPLDTPTSKTKKAKKPKKSSKKVRQVIEKEPAIVHGDSSSVPPEIHEYLINRYSNVHYCIGELEDENTRQFKMYEPEDKSIDYTVKMNVTGGGRDVVVKTIFPNN